jgi:Coenzyme PQQ synthesis protein D (PqqD)
MTRTDMLAPKAREDRLVVKELANETLVYDENGHKAHCLNQTAAFVWKHCDGHRSVKQIAGLLEREMKTPDSEQMVLFALGQLEKSRLLDEPVAGTTRAALMSRRELVRQLGIGAAVALPIVTSLVAPTATEAQTITCVPLNGVCTETADCCPELQCLNCGPGLRCVFFCPETPS